MAKKRSQIPGGFDRHHLFYQRRHYAAALPRKLRAHPYCLVPIPRDTLHRAIHMAVRGVPVPNDAVLKAALDRLKALWNTGAITSQDTIERRLQILIPLFADAPSTQQALQAQLAVCKQCPRH